MDSSQQIHSSKTWRKAVPLQIEVRVNNIYRRSLCSKGNTTPLHYNDKIVNAIWGNKPYLVWKSQEAHKYALLAKWNAELRIIITGGT